MSYYLSYKKNKWYTLDRAIFGLHSLTLNGDHCPAVAVDEQKPAGQHILQPTVHQKRHRLVDVDFRRQRRIRLENLHQFRVRSTFRAVFVFCVCVCGFVAIFSCVPIERWGFLRADAVESNVIAVPEIDRCHARNSRRQWAPRRRCEHIRYGCGEQHRSDSDEGQLCSTEHSRFISGMERNRTERNRHNRDVCSPANRRVNCARKAIATSCFYIYTQEKLFECRHNETANATRGAGDSQGGPFKFKLSSVHSLVRTISQPIING